MSNTNRPSDATGTARQPAAPPRSSARILIADDSRTVRTQVKRVLTQAGYAVTVARDGREAVRLAAACWPDLAVLDIQMPGMDGYATCQELLALSPHSHPLPIVFLTSVRAKHLDALGSELGAYLPKPVCPDLLAATVARLLVAPGECQPAR